MKQGLTELVFILDRSGSMSGLESDTIGGYNALLEKQKREAGTAIVTTVLFDDRYELLHDRIPLAGVAPITEKEYYVRGCTALLDAVGRTVAKIENAQQNTAEPERAERVLVVITTDGYENASKEYTADRIKAIIEQKRAACGWEFLFLGANIDAVKTAAHYGIPPAMAAQYRHDGDGVAASYCAMSDAASEFRRTGAASRKWKEALAPDEK